MHTSGHRTRPGRMNSFTPDVLQPLAPAPHRLNTTHALHQMHPTLTYQSPCPDTQRRPACFVWLPDNLLYVMHSDVRIDSIFLKRHDAGMSREKYWNLQWSTLQPTTPTDIRFHFGRYNLTGATNFTVHIPDMVIVATHQIGTTAKWMSWRHVLRIHADDTIPDPTI